MHNNGPSPHLSWKELACKDGTPYPEKFKISGRASELAMVFERIRSLYGKPITIVSAYRTESHNRKIGGARHSQHLQGRALDIKPPKGIKISQFYNDIKSHASEFGIGGIGIYNTFVHIDVRHSSSGRLALWSGSGLKDLI